MSFNVADGIHPAVMPYFNERGAVPPFLVIAFENKVAMSTLKDRLSSAPLVPVPKGKENDDGRGNNPQPPIDAVCLLGRGIVWNIRPGDPTVMRRPDTGEPIYGWRALDTQAPLALTLAWLHMTMPRIQRGASVFVPYLTPYARQLAYMTSGSFDPPVEPEEKPEGDTDGEPLD